MKQAQITKFSELSFYFTAQIDKINAALQDNNHTLVKIQQINTHIKKQENKIMEVDNKVKLLEVYQSENFKNNQRLFNAQQNFDSLDKKIKILEQMQSEIISHAQQKMMIINEQTFQRMHLMQQKLKNIENQVQKLRTKNANLTKFRRDLSPTIVNCDSTKDISVDRKSNRSNNQIKKIEAKMHEYINQRLKSFEKKIHSALNADREKLFDFQLPQLQNESFMNNRLTTEKTSNKNDSNANHTNLEKKQNAFQNNFRNTIQCYYNQTTQKEDFRIKKSEKQQRKQQNHHLKLQKNHSKSKSKKKIKDSSSKKSISLRTVNQYLKLAEKNK